MTQPEQEAFEARLSGQIAAYHDAALAYAAVKLGLPDKLAAQARTAEQLAGEMGLSAPHLHRFLRGLATLGVCEERPDRSFALTPAGHSLKSGSRLAAKVQIVVEQYWRPWSDLVSCLETGKPAFDQVFGMNVRDWRRSNAEQGALFDSYLAKERLDQSDALAEVLDLSEGKTIADIGEDSLRAIPADADLYVLNDVLRNLDDAKAVALLANCRKAMPETARLIIVERLMPEQADDDASAVMLDLHMMVITGGRVRTLAEIETLLAQAGLALANVTPTHPGLSVLTAITK